MLLATEGFQVWGSSTWFVLIPLAVRPIWRILFVCPDFSPSVLYPFFSPFVECFVVLALDLVFRFTIEYYSSLMDFGPLGNSSISIWGCFERWDFGFCWKLEINSYRVIIYLEGFWFLLEDVLKTIFLYGEIFECFHNSCFALRYFLMQMARPRCDTPLVLFDD